MGKEGWVPPAAAWVIGERSHTRDTVITAMSLMCDLSPITLARRNAGPPAPLSPGLHVSL